MNTAKHLKVHVTREHAHELMRQMILIRRFEEKCAELYTQEKIRGFLHLYIGEEANAVGVMQALTSEDAIVATYREHGHALVRGLPASAVMAEMYGKVTGCSRGHGGSMHLFSAAQRFYGGSLKKTLAAAEALAGEGVDCEVIDLRSLRPLDMPTLVESVRRTHRAVIVDEGWRTGSLAGEIAAQLGEQVFFELDAPIARVCSAEVPIPYPHHLEMAATPQVEGIVAAVHGLLRR